MWITQRFQVWRKHTEVSLRIALLIHKVEGTRFIFQLHIVPSTFHIKSNTGSCHGELRSNTNLCSCCVNVSHFSLDRIHGVCLIFTNMQSQLVLISHFFKSKNAILFYKGITKLRKNMQIFIIITLMKILLYCISSLFNFVFLQRRDRREAFFGDIFPQRAEPQYRS